MDLNQKTVQMTLIVVVFVMCQFWTGFTCPALCQCCVNDNCGDPPPGKWHGWGSVCLEGCKDGYHQARCMHTCSGNCQTCKQDDGACLTCIPGFYGLSSNCSNSCSHKNCACDHTPCDFCLNGFYNISNDCNLVCSKGCHNGKCNDNGTRVCIANFERDKCDFCVQGKYGDLCNNSCVNENCRCTYATDCVSCKSGYFDFSTLCSKQCSLGCENVCENDGTCKCLSQFTGPQCRTCLNGYFGNDCKTPCSGGCINGTCNINGTCQCLPNFDGDMCEICRTGYFGKFCDIQCGSGCTNNICDRYDGTCECEFNYKESQCNICKDGYFGINCNVSCPDGCYNCSSIASCFACKEGFYGLDCSQRCSTNCLRSQCEQVDGICTGGCLDGFTTANCTERCDGNCKICSQTNYTHCTACLGEFSGLSCKCVPNCQCELNNEVCKKCTNGFEVESKDCKCNKKYCFDKSHCTSCQNNTVYSYEDTCCECSTNCKNKQCLPVNQCLNGCEDGYTGVDCAELCTYYDGNCTKCNQTTHFCFRCQQGFSPNIDGVCTSCVGCIDKACDTTSGVCSKGCRLNFWTNTCEKECSSNCKGCDRVSGICNECTSDIIYGPFCNLTCSRSCMELQCNRTTGDCIYGCITNMYGPKCEYKCPESCEVSGENSNCGFEGQCLYNCKAGYQGRKCNIANSEKDNTVSTGAIAGGVGACLILFLVSCVIIFLVRRRIINQQRNASKAVYANVSGTSTSDVNDAGIAKGSNENDAAYDNDANNDDTHTVPVESLARCVLGKTEKDYEEEFQKFPNGLRKPYQASQLKGNVLKNRYRGIYPYDDSRVQIKGGESDYINASFIDGYNMKHAYIATLGPMSKQLGDFGIFWQMVWQQKVETIAMVTNLIEDGKDKCDQYWPDPGVSKTYGDITVSCYTENKYTEFTKRVFSVSKVKRKEKRMLHHLHFTCWPDRDVPDDVTAIIEFRQAVLNSPKQFNGPLLVHCSAGVGRTGTYIALDILTKEGEAEGAIDIPGCVVNMRQNRPNMIQTLIQYKYLHTSLVHSLTLSCSPIKADDFQQYLTRTRDSELVHLYEKINLTVETMSNEEMIAVERHKTETKANRLHSDIPGDKNRPRVYLNLKPGASDYINAVYIDSFTVKDRYLVCQTPLKETVSDFVTLVMQEQCSCVVSFESEMEKHRNVGLYYPADNQELVIGDVTVRSHKVEGKDYYQKRTLTITHDTANGHSDVRTIPNLQFTDWDKKHNVPRSTQNVLAFIEDVDAAAKASRHDGPILVHCLDGASKSGIFCVVSLLLQRVAVNQEVSVVNVVRKVRTRRKLAIPNKEQFHFCHECVLGYINTRESTTYYNTCGGLVRGQN
ncbi:multiple epidermal growth factor-like domains protein 11 isoform X2 [Mya arenaria]|uniref:multiple epidermal growth factor-like domains protein 11 isoform X2 n=1 Tax=Mya arenaria TaxID=6604 RepID=UPI0022E6E1A2|nr:multiple epidermal growth factor-like domains protein 11 isoform X2 [Mya arenaria]